MPSDPLLPDRTPAESASNEPASAVTQIGLGPLHAFPHDRTVLDLFSERVAAAPDRLALRHREISMTYAQLDHATNVVARRLIAAGVPARRLVPLLITDGPEFPIALFGVLKAGAAFVPLDPSWPAERLKAITVELNPPAILATPASSAVAAQMGLAEVAVLVDRNDPDGDGAAPPAERRPAPGDLIYGYYTSGSTGVPKCALNRHRGLVNRLTAMSRRFGHGVDHVTLQNSRSTFDSSMWQVLWPLVSGGQVVLPHRDGILDLEQTALTIGRYGVTITDFVPSVLAAYVSLLELRPDLQKATSTLRRMLIGGEAANPSVVHRLRTLLPELKVTNTYGPTECSIGSVFHDIGDADVERIPLGRAIDNTAAIILDDDRRPVPPGTVGEVYLGGECLGAGYLDDADRTALAFVPNPFAHISGELLYRTGDLAHVDGDGNLHFVGRRDEQVKIGGVRVELGDVAAALASHPLVGNAMAVVLGDADEPALVCCVSPRFADNPPTVPQLRRHAADKLPAELVPHRIMVLPSLPVNNNGKADRKRLAALLAAEVAAGADDFEPPANPMEELVRDAWREVLGIDRVSVLVPFGEYGGSSLTAYRLTVAVSARLGRPVPPRHLLMAPTVRAQAAVLTHGAPDDSAERAYIVRDVAWLPPKVILLTGGTGFIGAHLLAELLRHSDARLICLVRASDARDGQRRLAAALEQYGLSSAWQLFPVAVKTGRVEVVAGDLGRERLGLSEARFAKIAAAATGVVHAGAMVNFLASYLSHRPANVLGMQELIRLAAEGNVRLHVLSTLSIFPPDGRDAGRIDEQQLPAPDQLAAGGYSSSKYVAERLLANARGHGISSVVYRLGEVWPHTEFGIANPASVAHNVLYACARTGCYFDTDATIDVTPVDVVSRFVARAAIGEQQVPDGAYHVLWPTTMRFADAFAALSARRRLDRVGYGEFRRRLEVLAEPPEPDERLARLRLVLPPAGSGDAASAEFDEMFAAGPHFDTTRFEQYATAMSLAPRQHPVRAVDGYLSRLSAAPSRPATAGLAEATHDALRDLARTADRTLD
jgi:amino acid adenylation domain-containing protein/thioester reductase-like protein